MKGFIYGFALATAMGVGWGMVATGYDPMLPPDPGMLDYYLLEQQHQADLQRQEEFNSMYRPVYPSQKRRRNPC